MATNEIRRAVGTFSDRMQAERALTQLRDAGFDMADVSVVSKHENDPGTIAGAEVTDNIGNKADEGAAKGATTGGVLGGLTGLLVGIGALAIPGIGPVMTAGAIGTALATTLAGGAIGAAAGGLVGALIGLGIPEERAHSYNKAVEQGGYLVLVDGSADEIRQAETILHSGGIQDYGVYTAPTGTYRDRTMTGTTLGTTGTPMGTSGMTTDMTGTTTTRDY
ncbi:general stress protein [Candidatus Cyanaurora vandensis]|uniref:general stress protein n=1 Tax=Candidatus Cyanaurora vandensis TaxID=2714958 RepID=UPI00257DB690|nr:general stress protein [Candidatus Cyanaurora vandensis]